MRQPTTEHKPRRTRANTLMIAAALLATQALPATAARGQETPPPPPATQPATADDLPLISRGLDEKGGGVTLIVNQSRQITTAVPVRAVDVTQPDVIGAKVISPTEIVLAARKPGTSQLVLWDDQHRSITVDVTVEADLKGLRTELERDFPRAHIEASSANGTIVLRGHVASAELSDKIVQVTTPFAPKIVNLLEISGGQQVTLQVRFAEVSRDAISALGVNFGGAGNSGFGASVIGGVGPLGITTATGSTTPVLAVGSPSSTVTAFGRFTAGVTPFDVFVTAMRQNNLLRVLAEPNLTVMSGNQASFLAGGEYPYPVPQSGGAGGGSTTITIEYKQYGVRLVFTPVVLGDGRIRLHVAPEVSDLDYNHTITLQGFVVPGLITRTADTIVELREGQTLSMAGLLNSRVTASNTSTPVLGDIPVLGALFRSVRYERQETELVVLVTPILAGAMDPAQVPPLPGERWRYPTEGKLFLKGDLGGPLADTANAPARVPPRDFHGTYGFAPATPAVANGK